MCISSNGLIIAHIVSKRNTLYQSEKALVGGTQHSIHVLPSMWATKFHIITNYKIHVFREQTGRNMIPNGAAMTGSAAHELFTMYGAMCTLHKYLRVDRLKVDTNCRTTTMRMIAIIIATIT
jgi:hypothetical protein